MKLFNKKKNTNGNRRFRPRSSLRKKENTNRFFLVATTIFTLIIAITQSIITYKQLEASKLSYLPFFIIKEKSAPSKYLKDSEDESLEIVNLGFPIINYNAEFEIYLKATKTINHYKKTVANLYFPIQYYDSNTILSGGKDTLQTMSGTENKGNLDFLQKELRNKNFDLAMEGVSYDISVTRLIKIQYQDIEGTPHTQFFINKKSVSLDEYQSFKKTIEKEKAKRDDNGDSLPESLEDFSTNDITKRLDEHSSTNETHDSSLEKIPALIIAPPISRLPYSSGTG